MTHSPHARVNTCTQVCTKLTYVLSRKVLSLTKPKGIKRNPSAIILHISSSCRAASTDIPDPLSPLLPIVHRFWQVFRATSRILTKPRYVGSSLSSCFCLAIWWGPQENMTYDLVPASPAMSCVSDSFKFDSFRNGGSVAVQMGLCGVLPPGLVQNFSQHSYVVAVKLFLHPFSLCPCSASIW